MLALLAYLYASSRGLLPWGNRSKGEPVPQMEFARVLARVVHRPAIAPMPAFAARALFGRLADPLLLEGVEARPSILESLDFRFEHRSLEACLRTLLDGVPPAD